MRNDLTKRFTENMEMTPEQRANFERRVIESDAQEIVANVSSALDGRIAKENLPGCVIIHDNATNVGMLDGPRERLWIPTGMWQIELWRIDSKILRLQLYMVWKSEGQKPNAHVHTKPNVPKGFYGSSFMFPYRLDLSLDLTETPMQGSWVAGTAPEVPEDVQERVRELLRIELNKKPYIGNPLG